MKILLLILFSACSTQLENQNTKNNAENTDKSTSFLVFGDWGQGTDNQKKVSDRMSSFCKEKKCDHGILLGDNFYPAGVSSITDEKWQKYFHSMYDQLGLLFHVTLGNHDYLGNIQAEIDYTQKSPKQWYLPSKYYSKVIDDVQLISIDTNNFDQEQMKWLKKTLSESKSIWNIVFGHHPIFSGGLHGDNLRLVVDLLPILNEYKVPFYLAGHDHDLQLLQATKLNFKTLLLVSGAAAESRLVRKNDKHIFAQQDLGFSFIKFIGKKAELSIVPMSHEVKTFSYDVDKIY